MKKGLINIFLVLFMLISSTALAQNKESSDAYDPFVDYSEYEENSDEEADINFFRNGRFFTLGLTMGHRMFTGGMQNIYDNGLQFGLFLSYFFDLRFALQINYTSSSHAINFVNDVKNVTGDSSFGTLTLALKYYFNTQNVTKGLAALNPYILGGYSQVSRETSVTAQDAFGKDNASGFDMGGGLEIPMMRNKMYLGFQVVYQFVNFPGENSYLEIDNGMGVQTTSTKPDGDFILSNVILGINF